MSQHLAKISWKRQTKDFAYDTYNRTHTWAFDDGTSLTASAAPEFNGGSIGVDPEEALVSATASCHMLTFLAIASKKGYVVDTYSDQAIGSLEKIGSGQLAVTKILLSPKVTFSGEKIPSDDQLASLHESAHRNCFIANSIKAEVTIQ